MTGICVGVKYLPELCKKYICVVTFEPFFNQEKRRAGTLIIHTPGEWEGHEQSIFLPDATLAVPSLDIWGKICRPWLEAQHGILEGVIVPASAPEPSPEEKEKPDGEPD